MTATGIVFKPKQTLAWDCMLSYRYSLLYGGSRSGKSFAIIAFLLFRANKKKSRHAILRFHFSDVKKSIIKETLPKVAEMMGIAYSLNQQDWYITLPNGSEIWFAGVDEGRGIDRILGKEYSTIFFNEASEIKYNSFVTVLTRLAEKSGLITRCIIDENPPKKSHWTYKLFFDKIEPESRTLLKYPNEYGELQLNPKDNEENIDENYIRMLEQMPPKQRKRFLEGEFSEDVIGALFTERCLNQYRVISHPELKEICVSIDPAVTAKNTSDETGIVVTGKGYDDRGYLLEDKSGIYKPSEWAEIGVTLFRKWDADYIVAESNQGGDMVKHTIQTEDKNVPVRLVHASKGKILRAEPISALYEDGRISHVGSFTDAEDEMINYTGQPEDKSPNRLDAIVHGFTALFPIGKSVDLEYFNREKIKFFDEYDFTGSINIGFIKITKADNYNFTMLSAKIKNKSVFVTNAIFNNFIPFENIDEIKRIVQEDNISKIFIECDISYAAFSRELYLMGLCQMQGVRPMDNEENRILVESKFITEKFVFKKDHEDIQYKDFMRQFHRYTSVAEKDEVFAPDAICGLSVAVKKMYSEYI